MIKLDIYEDLLQCPSSNQAIRKGKVVSDAMKNTKSRIQIINHVLVTNSNAESNAYSSSE